MCAMTGQRPVLGGPEAQEEPTVCPTITATDTWCTSSGPLARTAEADTQMTSPFYRLHTPHTQLPMDISGFEVRVDVDLASQEAV